MKFLLITFSYNYDNLDFSHSSKMVAVVAAIAVAAVAVAVAGRTAIVAAVVFAFNVPFSEQYKGSLYQVILKF